MSKDRIVKLYEKLPAVYRLRDAERGYPLRGLLRIIEEQADILKRDIDGLWDDLFVETCAEWVIPYIGDLVGNNPLHEATLARRADVAKTIYYRRRKGTLPMLEELARDVTGWGMHAVEFFRLMGWNQNLTHVRYHPAANPLRRDPPAVESVGTVHLRDIDALDRLEGPFDGFSHSADIRPTARAGGWHHMRNVGFFAWRLQSYPFRGVPAEPSSDAPYGWHLSPLGAPAPLFTNPEREAAPSGLATELHVPGSIRPISLSTDLENCRRAIAAGMPPESAYYGQNRSLRVMRDGEALPPESILCMNLSAGWCRPPDSLSYTDADGNEVVVSIEAGIDPNTGRIVFPTGKEPDESVYADFHNGFSGDVGGGPYGRRATFLPPSRDGLHIVVSREEPSPAPTRWRSTVADALSDWVDSGARIGVIEIADNDTYEEPLAVEFSGNQHLTLRAADGMRPLLRPVDEDGRLSEITAGGSAGEDATLRINGLLMEGGIRVEPGSLGDLCLVHSTLVPGRHLDEEGRPVLPEFPSITADAGNPRLRVTLDHCVTGPLRLDENLRGLSITDSIINAPRGELALHSAALLSGNLSPFPELDTDPPAVRVSMGGEGPYAAEFADVPGSLAEARDMLQDAVREAHDTPSFTRAVVATTAGRLVVLPGVPGAEPQFEDAGSDDTAMALRLVPGEAAPRQVLASAPVREDLQLAGSPPAIRLRMGEMEAVRLELEAPVDTLARVQVALEGAVRSADDAAAFTDSRILRYRDADGRWRLAVMPGSESVRPSVQSAPDDPETALQLRLRRTADAPRHALCAPGDGMGAGPPTTCHRTTFSGRVRVKQLVMASETIFTAAVTAERRQQGCVRFSYVPDTNSETPRRYRCQPDLALQELADERGLESVMDLPAADRALVRSRLRPTSTSIHYSDPPYAQLSLTCAGEIRTGGQNDAEMGVFNELKQPQRETNLRIRLQEYLPFGLRPEIIRVT
ncbi:MAG: hypothetical protein V5A84_02555 [Planctomycetota bacterium]